MHQANLDPRLAANKFRLKVYFIACRYGDLHLEEPPSIRAITPELKTNGACPLPDPIQQVPIHLTGCGVYDPGPQGSAQDRRWKQSLATVCLRKGDPSITNGRNAIGGVDPISNIKRRNHRISWSV
jgi:hypothetical protein